MVGARAIGMGGAFSAVASDASVAHWNPAALASLQRQEIGLAYADRFGLGLNHSYLNYVLPVGDHHALGIDWLHLGFDDSELSTGQNKLSFAYGYRNGVEFLRPFIGNTAVGVSGKYRSFNVDLDGNNLGSASGWGFDLGLLAPLPYGLAWRWSLKTWAALTYSMKTGYPRRCMIRAIAWACPTVPLRASRSAWTWTIRFIWAQNTGCAVC